MYSSLGIIIVNYNSAGLLEHCINSISKSNIEELSIKIIVVDNNSKDNSLQLKLIDENNLIVIKNKENKGFGYACNQGVAALGVTDYLLFLNPDTEVSVNTFIESINFLNGHKDVSILGVLHKDKNGQIQKSCSNTPTPKRIIWDILGLSKLIPKIFKPATLMTNFDHRESRFVDQVMGAYMLMGRKVFDEVGMFDTRFFVYYEDADFALRANRLGLHSFYNSDINILHHGRGTVRNISHLALFYNLRSRTQFVFKHYGRMSGSLILSLSLIIEPFTRFLFNMIRHPSENKNTFKAYRLLYKYTFKR